MVNGHQGAEGMRKKADAYAVAVGPMAQEMHQAGASLRKIAAELNAKGIRTPRGGQWTGAVVRSLLERLLATGLTRVKPN
jgi:hypothetical protein